MNISISLTLRKKPDKAGECPVFVAIRGSGAERYHSTGIKVHPEYWTGKEIKKGWPNADILNNRLQSMLQQLERNLLIKQSANVPLSPDVAKELLQSDTPKKAASDDFHAFFGEYITYQKSKMSPGYVRHLTSSARMLKKYHPTLRFRDITAAFLEGYEMSLTCLPTTKHTKMKRIKEVVARAVARGHIPPERVAGYKLPPYRSPDVEYLTLGETERIMDALNKGELDFNPAMRAVAAYFLIECYSGIRFSDWGRFTVETMSQARYLKVRAKKNGEPVYLPLQVFGRLAGIVGYIEENNLVFNVPARETNLLLKAMAATLKLSISDLTTHVGRHTCGTLLAEMGYNTRQIGEVLGISEKTAAVYIKNTRQGLTNAFARFGGL